MENPLKRAAEWWKDNDHPYLFATGAFLGGVALTYLGVELFVPGGYDSLPSFSDQAQAAAGFLLEQAGLLPVEPDLTPILDQPLVG